MTAPSQDVVAELEARIVVLEQRLQASAAENARLLEEAKLAHERQTATAEVLQVISQSAFDLRAVLQTLVEIAAKLCRADAAQIYRREGELYRSVAMCGKVTDAYRAIEEATPIRPGPETLVGRVALQARVVQIRDAWSDPDYGAREDARIGNVRSMLGVPLIRNGDQIGTFALARDRVETFSDSEIELVRTFADQAVIAIENARLFSETRDALDRQTATADILRVISRSPTDARPVFEAIARRAKSLVRGFSSTVFRFADGQAYLEAFTPTTAEADQVLTSTFPRPVADFAPFRLTQSGEVTQIPDIEALTNEIKDIGRARGFRSMLFAPLMNKGASIGFIAVTRVQPGRFAEQHVQLLRTFADQAVIAIENARLFNEVQERTRELGESLDELRNAQDRLVQTEKLASLGQLTAGIAHEIKNPLNFVNNFAALSVELAGELNDLIAAAAVTDDVRAEVDELAGLLKDNLLKVVQHGKRADSIVKNMLMHSREGGGEHRPTDVNALVEESLNLAYHGARAEKPQFNVTIERDLDPSAGSIEVFPQEITRVLLNLIANGFYAAVKRKAETSHEDYEPVVMAHTRGHGGHVEIRIRDNGTGIPPEIREKMFTPFFTTKPAGEGTGLGLSMSHDIIVKQHGGTIDVESVPGEFTEFTIRLPRKSNFSDKSRG